MKYCQIDSFPVDYNRWRKVEEMVVQKPRRENNKQVNAAVNSASRIHLKTSHSSTFATEAYNSCNFDGSVYENFTVYINMVLKYILYVYKN